MHPYFDSIREPLREPVKETDQESNNYYESSVSKLNDTSRLSKNSTNMSLLSGSTLNENQKSSFMIKKFPVINFVHYSNF